MKKIVFVHSTLDIGGGAEMMRFMLLNRLDKGRYGIKVCCIGQKGFWGRQLETLGYEVVELNQDRNSLNVLITYRLMKFLKKEKPDIVHSSLFKTNFHSRLAALFCRVPHVIIEEHGEHREYRGIKFLPYLFLDFMLSNLTTFIVCCSEGIREDIVKKEKLPRRKVVCIENCLDRKLYRVSVPREEMRRKYGVTDELVFIVVASLKAGKGHGYLLEALKDIKDTGYRFTCLFAGGGPLNNALKQKCSELGLSKEVRFLGRINNVPDHLNASNVFILPSDSEGHSIALMEAMLMGLACIATSVGTNPDLVKTGFNGTIIRPKDRQGLKDAILFYLKDRSSAEVFGKRSRDIAEKRHCSADEYTRKYYELWDKCASGKK